MADEQHSPFDEALNIDSLSLADLEADLQRLEEASASPETASPPSDESLSPAGAGDVYPEGGDFATAPGETPGSSSELTGPSASEAAESNGSTGLDALGGLDGLDGLGSLDGLDGFGGLGGIPSALDGPSDGLEALTGIRGSSDSSSRDPLSEGLGDVLGADLGAPIGVASGAVAAAAPAIANAAADPAAPTAESGNAPPATRTGFVAGVTSTLRQWPAQLFKSRWVAYGLAAALLIPLGAGLIWGLNRAWDHYLTPPEAYPPERLAEYTQAAKVVRTHIQGDFTRLGQAITTNDKHLIEEALTDASPRRDDAEQAIHDWQGFFSRYKQFEKPEFNIRVFLVRDVAIEPHDNTVEAVADVSTFSSYQVNNRRLEKSVDYELWVRLVYKDGHWRLDDYRNVGEGTAGHTGGDQGSRTAAVAPSVHPPGDKAAVAAAKGSNDGSPLDRLLFRDRGRDDSANRVADATPAGTAGRLFRPLPADLRSRLEQQ
ncbi:hypothetical protein GTO89_14230 [Heliobacterium gestii]|uniref:Uncharacterized protein n=1 Tax=Heliomicrobium gestii TaxID=2699 RepID=A0A845LC04_HELGE|nr:hypothetical protein [Heliomicrobium gestii]MBM7867799.1 hypothetical protein [Heliomicrobium gestii]MZP44192.1 hypothetical protein [Heliomicrobium gestii]